jgi:succinate dehydrogenase / fumarate reductase cytochrome b subunit
MSWFTKTFSSSIGKKLIMSLAGLFLVVFLLVHLGINLSIIFAESNDAFNKAAYFMGHNYVIKVFEIVLFGGFFLHIIYGLILQIQNWMARPKRYKVSRDLQTSFFSKYMIHTAIIVLIFLVLHVGDFYVGSKFLGKAGITTIDGKEYKDLASMVVERFHLLGYVIFYIVALIILGFHLNHGFQSAFQTLGINHKKYTPFIKGLGTAYSILVPAGFIAIPVVIYFFS